jgi:hypothetical protein
MAAPIGGIREVETLRFALRPRSSNNNVESAGGAMSTRFPDMTKRAFLFLEDAGFRLVQSNLSESQYETDRVFVTIGWDARSGELDVFVGLQPRKGKRQDTFSLSDLLRMEGVDVQERQMPFQVADESRLGPFLEKLAEDMRTHAQPVLAGDRLYFRRLEAFRHAQSQVYMRDMKLQQVRSEAEKAWRKRELDKVLALYTSIEDDLSASEKGKLAYAKQHQPHSL